MVREHGSPAARFPNNQRLSGSQPDRIATTRTYLKMNRVLDRLRSSWVALLHVSGIEGTSGQWSLMQTHVPTLPNVKHQASDAVRLADKKCAAEDHALSGDNSLSATPALIRSALVNYEMKTQNTT